MGDHSKGPWTTKKVRCSTVFLDGNGDDMMFVGLVDGAPYAIFSNDADTRLIAAAPDLLAALNAAKTWIEDYTDPCGEPYNTICAAITKASE